MAGRGGGSKGGGGDRKLTFKEKSSIKFVEGDEPDFIKKMKAKMGFREAATVEDKVSARRPCYGVESELESGSVIDIQYFTNPLHYNKCPLISEYSAHIEFEYIYFPSDR